MLNQLGFLSLKYGAAFSAAAGAVEFALGRGWIIAAGAAPVPTPAPAKAEGGEEVPRGGGE